jgi:hypothetical protein
MSIIRPWLLAPRWSGNPIGVVGASALLLLVLASVPVFSTSLPPLVDYPNHLARFWVLATGGNEFYGVHWAPLPNLAGDLIVPPLARVMPLELAGKLFLVAIFALMLGGAIWLNRIATGAWRLWPLLTAALLYNRSFLWGFINYLFGLGIALCGAALWLQLETARAWIRVLASSLVALLCFFSHIAAFGVYALVILGLEVEPAISELRARAWRELCRGLALAVPQLIAPVLLLLGWWHSTAGGVSYSRIWRKADLLFSVFDNYSRSFDIACFALLLLLFAVLAWRRRLGISARMGPVVALVFAAYLSLPSQMLSGSGADHRIAVALFVLLVASSAPRFASPRAAVIVGAATLLLLAGRFGVIEAAWLSADRVYTADLAGLDALPLGSKLAVAFPPDAVNTSPIPVLHLPTLAVARRDAFVPTVFAYPAQQPIVVEPPYDRLASAASPTLLWSAFVAGDVEARQQAWTALAGWDAIAFVDRHPFRVPAQPCLRPLVAEPNFQVFLLLKGGNCRAG